MKANKVAQNILGWGGLAVAIVGLVIGMSSRKATLGGGTLQCGSPWAPVENEGMKFIYPAIVKACDKAIGSSGTVAAVLVGVGVVMLIAVLTATSMVPIAPSAGTSDHP